MLTIALVLTLATTITSTNVASFSAEELRFFASLGLCKHFGGSCGLDCPFRYIRHRWNVPLCPSTGMECCIGPPSPPEADSAPADRPENSPHSTSTIIAVSSTTTTATTTTAAPIPSALPLRQQAQRQDSCGLAPPDGMRRKRIVGGTLATPGRWPWLVALRSMLGAHACSGALVGQHWIVTAAHCFKHISNPSLWRVRVGEYDLLRHDAGERDLHIDTIITNPGYGTQTDQNASNHTLYTQYVNDIALVRLQQAAGAEPICLPESMEEEVTYEECWVAGWGVTMDGMNSDQRLRQVTGPVIPNEQCSQMWSAQLQENMMCFGDGTYGPCAGDSGGPMSCRNRQGRYSLEGVVSWGTEDCNLSGYPSVFTRVRPYLSWIRQHITDGGQV